MKNVCLVLFVFSALFCSCSGKGKKSSEGVVALSLSMDKASDKVKLSQIASSVECVFLDTSGSVLIGEIVRVINKNDFVYIADKSAVYKYDKSGKYISHLRESGEGPDKYVSISDFQITPTGDIWILSRNNQCLYRYNVQYELQEKMPFDCWVSNISLVGSDKMLLYVGNETGGGNTKQLKQLNLLTKEISDGYLTINPKKSNYLHILSENTFSGGDAATSHYFFQPFNDTIYQISPQASVSPVFCVNIANKNIPVSFFDEEYENVMVFFQHLSKESYAYGTTLFAEYEHSYLFAFNQSGQQYLSVLPKDSSVDQCVFKSIVVDTHFRDYILPVNDLKTFVQENHELIIPLSASDILESVAGNMSKEELDVFKKKFKSEAEDQNPVLLCVRLK